MSARRNATGPVSASRRIFLLQRGGVKGGLTLTVIEQSAAAEWRGQAALNTEKGLWMLLHFLLSI